MKKIYSLFLVLTVAMLSMTSSAKMIHLLAEEGSEGLVTLVDEANDINVTLTGEYLDLEVPTEGHFVFYAADGYVCGKVSSVIIGQVGGYNTDRSAYAESSFDMNWAMFAENSYCIFSVADPNHVSSKKVTFVGLPDAYTVRNDYSYEYYTPDADGKIVDVNWEGVYSFTVYANDGYRVTSLKDQYGTPYGVANSAYSCAYTNYWPDDEMTINVDLLDLSTIEFAKMTVNIDGEAFKVSMVDAATWTTVGYFNSGANEVSFEVGQSFRISNSYNSSLGFYKVTLDGVDVPNANGYYIITPSDGSVLDIEINYPLIEIPVNITFGGTADAGIITSMNYDGDFQMTLEKFAAMTKYTGKTLNLYFDTQSYENLVVKVNGEEQTNLYSYLSLTFADENGYEIEISADKLEPYKVTIVTNDPTVLGYRFSSYGDAIALTEQVTEIEVNRGNSNIYFVPAADYYLSNITVADDPYFTFSGSNSYYIQGDCEIEVEVAKAERDREVVLYIDPANWTSFNFTLSANSMDFRKAYCLYDLTASMGYNFIPFGAFDTPFYLTAYVFVDGGYLAPVVYLNDEPASLYYGTSGSILGTDDCATASVIKVMAGEKEKVALTYTITDDVNVDVKHDYVTAVEFPGFHNVLPGTMVHVSAAEAAAAGVLRADDNNAIAVTVNDQPVEADENGVFAFTVSADTNVKIGASTSAGIEIINADAAAAANDIYNLQGIKMQGDVPAGIYVRGGKKVVVK